MKRYTTSPQRGFPYRKIAREIVAERLARGKTSVTLADFKAMAKEAFKGLLRANTRNAPIEIDLRDAAFALSTALADEIEKAIFEALKTERKKRRI